MKCLFIVFLLFLLNCSDDVSGGAGDVGNPSITAIVVDSLGVPYEGAKVTLIHQDYLPHRENCVPKYTSSNGYCFFDISDNRNYYLYAQNDSSGVCQSSLFSINESSGDTIVLKLYESSMLIVKSWDSAFDTAFIAGTPFWATKSVGEFYKFNNLTQGNLGSVYLQSDLSLKKIIEDLEFNLAEKKVYDSLYSWTALSIPADFKETKSFFYLTYAQDGDVWATCFNGLVIYKNGIPEIRESESIGLSSSGKLYNMVSDKFGTIWIATSEGLLQFKDGLFKLILSSTTGLSTSLVSCVTLGADSSTVWIGGDSSVAFFNGSSWVSYTTSNSNISSAQVRAIASNGKNEVFIGFNLNGFAIVKGGVVTEFDSLKTATIHTVESDDTDRFWFSSTEGSYILNDLLLAKGFPNYDQIEGVSVSGIRYNPKSKVMWIATKTGVYSYYQNIWTHYSQIHEALDNTAAVDICFNSKDLNRSAVIAFSKCIVSFEERY